jgi:hypothetical protein
MGMSRMEIIIQDLRPQGEMELMLIVYGQPEAHCHKTMAEEPA